MFVERDRSRTSGQPTYSKEKVTQVTVSYSFVAWFGTNHKMENVCLRTVTLYVSNRNKLFYLVAMYKYTAVGNTSDMKQFINIRCFFAQI